MVFRMHAYIHGGWAHRQRVSTTFWTRKNSKFFLCPWGDSNPRPLDLQSNTLTTEPTRHPISAFVLLYSWHALHQRDKSFVHSPLMCLVLSLMLWSSLKPNDEDTFVMFSSLLVQGEYFVNTWRHKCLHICNACMHTHTCCHAHICIYMYTHTTHTCMHTYMCTHMHTHPCTYTHTNSDGFFFLFLFHFRVIQCCLMPRCALCCYRCSQPLHLATILQLICIVVVSILIHVLNNLYVPQPDDIVYDMARNQEKSPYPSRGDYRDYYR